MRGADGTGLRIDVCELTARSEPQVEKGPYYRVDFSSRPEPMTQFAKLAPDVIRAMAATHGVDLDHAAAARIADAFGANLAISQADVRQLPLELEPPAWALFAKRYGRGR